MTREEILDKWESITPKERNAWIAIDVIQLDESKFHFDEEMGISERIRYNEFMDDYVWEPFNPSTDISTAWEVEEKIKEIGGIMIGYYMTELLLIVGNNGFDMVHATPEQRCKAALLAVLDSNLPREEET